jgi:hypothetical protein
MMRRFARVDPVVSRVVGDNPGLQLHEPSIRGCWPTVRDRP